MLDLLQRLTWRLSNPLGQISSGGLAEGGGWLAAGPGRAAAAAKLGQLWPIGWTPWLVAAEGQCNSEQRGDDGSRRGEGREG